MARHSEFELFRLGAVFAQDAVVTRETSGRGKPGDGLNVTRLIPPCAISPVRVAYHPGSHSRGRLRFPHAPPVEVFRTSGGSVVFRHAPHLRWGDYGQGNLGTGSCERIRFPNWISEPTLLRAIFCRSLKGAVDQAAAICLRL